MAQTFDGTFESLCSHPVPDWFHDAKFGIFVHWTMSCIPAFAPQSGSLPEILREHPKDPLKFIPYAEWYQNTAKFPDSEVAGYHREHYGNAPYQAFREPFEAGLDAWDPEPLVDLIVDSGARYVVYVTKHHDGFVLWPTDVPNPHAPGWNSRRDMVGDLAAAVRRRGLRFGVYYSGGLDWTFNPEPIASVGDMFASIPRSLEYRQYADAHLRELISRYQPSVLWNDIAYPPGPELPALMAHYYSVVPDGVVNDRWAQPGEPGFPAAGHYDFQTPEYAQYAEIRAGKWEATRGIGHSFGYAANEPLANVISPAELIHSFVDGVSKNGNLLLNIGPRPDGSAQPEHEVPLRALGAWLRANGEAVYGTRPWDHAEGAAYSGERQIPLRFTAKGDRLFATVLGPVDSGALALDGLGERPGSGLRILANGEVVSATASAGRLSASLPVLARSDAHAFEILR